MRCIGRVSQIGRYWGSSEILYGKETYRVARWEKSIRMMIKEIGVNTMDWKLLVEDRKHYRGFVKATLRTFKFLRVCCFEFPS